MRLNDPHDVVPAPGSPGAGTTAMIPMFHVEPTQEGTTT